MLSAMAKWPTWRRQPSRRIVRKVNADRADAQRDAGRHCYGAGVCSAVEKRLLPRNIRRGFTSRLRRGADGHALTAGAGADGAQQILGAGGEFVELGLGDFSREMAQGLHQGIHGRVGVGEVMAHALKVAGAGLFGDQLFDLMTFAGAEFVGQGAG